MELPAILLLCCSVVGAVLVLGGAWYVVREMSGSSTRLRDVRRLQDAAHHLARAEELFQSEQFFTGLESLRRSVLLAETMTPSLLRVLRDHHELVVGQFVALVERCDQNFSLVVDLDFLLTQRHDLLALLNHVQQRQLDSLLDDLVDLSRTRESEIAQELRINRTSLFFAIERLCGALRTGPVERSAITYH